MFRRSIRSCGTLAWVRSGRTRILLMKRTSFYSYALVIAIACLHLFEKSRVVKNLSDKLEELEDQSDFGRIRCPLCRWQPRRFDRWCCVDCADPEYFFNGCGAVWNTFETRGVCPNCSHHWQWTACLACHGWSLHEDWYVENRD